MKLKFRIAAGIISAAMAIGAGSVCSFADTVNTDSTVYTEEPTNNEPYLGSGAVNGGYYISAGSLKELETATITVMTYIPIENFPGTLSDTQKSDLICSSIFAF